MVDHNQSVLGSRHEENSTDDNEKKNSALEGFRMAVEYQALLSHSIRCLISFLERHVHISHATDFRDGTYNELAIIINSPRFVNVPQFFTGLLLKPKFNP